MVGEIDIKTLKGITQDSRNVKDGYVFAALGGSKVDGRDFIKDAVAKGARVVLAGTGTQIPEEAKASGVTFILDENPRRRFAKLVAEFYALHYHVPPAHIVAVTGTNGKTSTALFVQQIWEALGHKSASLGTLGIRGAGVESSGTMTTPDPVTLHARLADLAAVGVDHLALEASSHGLDQYRLDGLEIKAAGFTNLTRDHLDYHADMESYFAAKARLFSEVLRADGVAVLNADVPEYARLSEICARRGVQVISYGCAAKDLKIQELVPVGHGQDLRLSVFGKMVEISLPLVGVFQVMNVLCALGLVLAQDRGRVEEILAFLPKIQGAPGRLQFVAGHPTGAGVYVDYAHTPDALENVLKALRPHTAGKLVCVFGCGGDRDRGKRPVMGRIAVALADHVIVTDDNPRSEIPADVRAEVLAGAIGAREIGDRRLAIQTAINALAEGDVLVIAGKGHEQGQIFENHTDHFDDVEEARAAIPLCRHSRAGGSPDF